MVQLTLLAYPQQPNSCSFLKLEIKITHSLLIVKTDGWKGLRSYKWVRVGKATFPCSVAAYSYILYSVKKQRKQLQKNASILHNTAY